VFILSGCGSSETIEIFHFNDFHAMMLPAEKIVKQGDTDVRVDDGGGLARLVRAVKDQQTPESLVLFGGDFLQGTPFSTFYKGEESLRILNEFVNVATFGNHELDYGQENLRKLLSRAKFDMVCANVFDDKGELFAPQAYVIKEAKGFRIAIFGLLTPDTAFTTHPKNAVGLTIKNPADVAKELIPKLRNDEKADIVIALTHLGSDVDVKLAQEVSGIDLIVGGHSHTALTNGEQAGKTLVVQAGSYGKFLGKVTLSVDSKTKKVLSISSKLIPMTPDLPLDEDVAAIIDELNKKLGEELQQVIARAAVRLEGEKSKVRNEETNLGNLICDITRDIAKADVAVVNGGGIRVPIVAGDIRVNDVFTVIPFDNTICVLDVPGSVLAKIFDRVASKEPQTGNFLQISSGSGYTIKDGKAIDIIIAGAPVDPSRVYKVATSDFIAAGGAGFAEFASCMVIDTGFVMRDALIDEIRARGVINAAVEGRIKKQ
jgi:2',3'-cyclic-nucleotide 2'-phosphodiesterase (5'-nucleotidase family)